MPDPIVSYQPFGEIPAWPPSPARLDRELDANNQKIINVDWTGDPINLSTDVTGLLPLANIASNTGPYLLGSTATGSPVRITIGSNVTLSGDTLSAATSGGAGSGDFSTNTSTSVVGEIVLFSNTGGKQGKRSTGSGVCKLTSGVLGVGNITGNTDITGVIAASNMPALTGDVTSAGGTLTTAIGSGKVTNTMLAGGIAASNLVGTDINVVGTITSGQWAATAIPVAFGGTGSGSAAAARAALGIQTTTTNGDSDYSITASDSTVALNAALTAVRTWTLPQASTVNNGTTIRVTDSVAGVTTVNYVQIAPFAGDTINGSSNSFILNKGYAVITLTKTSSTNWNVLSTTSIIRNFFGSNQTYTTPVGIKALYVECVGGGGAGGGAAVASSNLSVGSGGGGGGYSSKFITSPLSSYLITVGLGGVGASGASGTGGGSTSFGAVCIATGGGAGTVISAGTSLSLLQGGTPGGASTGDLSVDGSSGGMAIRLSGTVGITGTGSASGLAYGGTTVQYISTTDGEPAGPYGYGTGGGGALTTGAAKTGGNGGHGICIVTEYY